MKKYKLIAHLNYGTLEQFFETLFDAYAKVEDLKKSGIIVKSYAINLHAA